MKQKVRFVDAPPPIGGPQDPRAVWIERLGLLVERPGEWAACDTLETLEGLNPHDHLWATRPGGRSVVRRRDPISNTTFERWWKRCIEAADVRYRNPHMARHSFVARLREKSVRIEDIKWMVGHESIATTEDIYSHPNMDELGDRVRSLVGDHA